MGFVRRPDPLEPPLVDSVRKYYLRIWGGGLAICVAGFIAGILLQRAHYRGQAGLVLAVLSAMLGVFFAFCLASDWSRSKA